MPLETPLFTRNRLNYALPQPPVVTQNEIYLDLTAGNAEGEMQLSHPDTQDFSHLEPTAFFPSTNVHTSSPISHVPSSIAYAFSHFLHQSCTYVCDLKRLCHLWLTYPQLAFSLVRSLFMFFLTWIHHGSQKDPLLLQSPQDDQDESLRKTDESSFHDAIQPEPNNYSRVLPEDMSIISIENTLGANMYLSIFEVDSNEDLVGANQQYGTALLSNKRPLRAAPSHESTTTSNANADLPFDLLLPRDEYDAAISRFYSPSIPLPKPKYSFTDALLSTLPRPSVDFLRKERQDIQDLITKERTALRESVPQLPKDKLEVVQMHWRKRNSGTPIVSAFSIDITPRDLLTLADGHWLNDNVIDFYLSLVAEKNNNVYCWTTHFFSTLKSKGYQGVARWAKRRKVNVTEKNIIIVPINIMSTHWALAVVDNVAKEIRYYDSLASSGNMNAVQLLAQYMQKEAERLQVVPIEYQLFPSTKTPQQQNGYDCGVFTCTVAKYISGNMDLTFSQKDMKTIRRRMAYEIIQKGLLDDVTDMPHL